MNTVVRCPFCENNSNFLLLNSCIGPDNRVYELIKCKICDAILNKTDLIVKNKEDIKKEQIEGSEQFYAVNEDTIQSIEESINAIAPVIENLFKLLPTLPRKSLLDFGAGSGYLAAAATCYYTDVHAVDYNLATIRILLPFFPNNERIHIYNDISDVSTKFDTIVCWHTLEHLDNAAIVIRKLLSLLNNGGVLYFQVPCFKYEYLCSVHYGFMNYNTIKTICKMNSLRIINISLDANNKFISCIASKNNILSLIKTINTSCSNYIYNIKRFIIDKCINNKTNIYGDTMPKHVLKWHTQCPMCGGDDIKAIFKILPDETFEIYKCIKCKQIFLNPWDMDSELENEYYLGKKYFDEAISLGIIDRYGNAVKENIVSRYIELTTIVKKYWSSGTIVDIGCCIGLSSMAISCMDIPVVPFEKNTYHCTFNYKEKEIKLNIQVQHGDVFTYSGDKFDFVTLNAVIEHVHSPKLFLNAIKTNMLNYHGLIVVTTHNIQSSQVISVGRSFENFNSGHVWHFSETTLNNLMNECGFRLIEYFRHSFELDEVNKNVEYYMNYIHDNNFNIYGSIAGIWIAI